VGGGITVNLVNHVKVDVGYKYSPIFVKTNYLQAPESPHQHKNVNVHRLQFGLGYTF
jgi:opacity protein-like surface antigen